MTAIIMNLYRSPHITAAQSIFSTIIIILLLLLLLFINIRSIDVILCCCRDVFLNDVKRELAFDPTGGRRVMSAGPCAYTGTGWVCYYFICVLYLFGVSWSDPCHRGTLFE